MKIKFNSPGLMNLKSDCKYSTFETLSIAFDVFFSNILSLNRLITYNSNTDFN